MIGVNFYGVLHGIRAFVPRMIEQQAPSHVVNVSSLAGVIEGEGPYDVSKHAVVALTEALYHELADKAPQVEVSVYCPGWVNTEFYAIDRSRPDRFSGEATLPTEQGRAAWREALMGGVSIEQSASALFDGLSDGSLYIGAKAYRDQLPGLVDAVRNRAENIINERNPEHPVPL